MMPYNPYSTLGRDASGAKQGQRSRPNAKKGPGGVGAGLKELGSLLGGAGTEEEPYDPIAGYEAALQYYDKPTSENLEALVYAMRPRPMWFRSRG